MRGRDIASYKSNFAGLYLINTHNGIPENQIDPIDIKQFPAIKKHLNEHIDKLEKRTDQGVTPFNLRSCAYMDDFSKQKIIWKRIGSDLRFSFDETGCFGLDSTCIATGKFMAYLTCVLNSKIGKYLMRNSPQTGTGDLIISVQAINPLCIPLIDENLNQKFYDYLLEFKERKRSTSEIENDILKKIAILYNFNEFEIEYIISL